MCLQEMESARHLFFECFVATNCWVNLGVRVGNSTNMELSDIQCAKIATPALAKMIMMVADLSPLPIF